MGALQAGQIQFGDFLLDTSERTLSRGGKPTYLPPRTFDTLLTLVRHSGQLVTKDDLIQAIWEGGVVTDNALTRCIKEVRQALGDDAKNPRFIETVPRVGYRFIAQVEMPADSVEAGPSDSQSGPTGEKPGESAAGATRRRFPAVLFGLITIIVLWVLLRSFGESPYAPGSHELLAMENSVAVLPFANFTENDDLDYFSDGIAEEVANHLSLVDGLSVLAFNISSRYRDPDTDPREAAGNLGVRYIVSGSLRRAGEAIRVSTTLVASGSGVQVWSMTEETTVLQAWSVQDSITQGVVSAMRSELNQEWPQTPKLARRAPDPEAYDLYLRGRFIWSRRGVEDLSAAIDMISEAVRVDPEFARGWSALASAYLVWPSYSPAGYRTWHLAREAAKRALELDTSLAEPRAVLASFDELDRDWTSAEKRYREALALEPRNATINYWFSEHLAKTGRYKDSITRLARARELDPTYLPTLVDSVFALALYGRTDEAARVFEQVWRSGIRHPAAVTAGFITSILTANFDRARSLTGEMSLSDEQQQTILGYIDVEAGMLDRQALVSRLEGHREAWPHYVIFVWMMSRIDAMDLATEALDRRIAGGGSVETRMLWGPGHRIIGNDDFARIANQIGLMDYWKSVAQGDFCDIEGTELVCSPAQPEDAPDSLGALLDSLE